MATIERRDGRYNVRWRVDGKGRRKTFARHADALEFKKQVESDAANGKAVDPTRSRTTYAEWYPVYTAGRLNVMPGTIATSKSLYANHVNRWDPWRLDAIKPEDVQKWVGEMVVAGKPATSTIHAVYKEFASSMRAAVRLRYLRESPCVGINLPVIERDPMTVLDHHEIALLASVINERYRALVVFLAYSGLRIGEAAALTWDEVDLSKGTVTVKYTATETSGQGLSLTPAKTRAGRRTVPLPQHVTDALVTHKQQYPSSWVFTTASGAQLNPRAFNRRSFATALKATGLSCHVHDLRHTAISLWIRAGVDLPRVKAWAGHTDAAFTLNTYAKFFPTDDAGVMAMLNQNITDSQTAYRII